MEFYSCKNSSSIWICGRCVSNDIHPVKKIIDKIEVDKDGNMDIYLKLLGDMGLDEAILVEGWSETTDTETVQNNYYHT